MVLVDWYKNIFVTNDIPLLSNVKDAIGTPMFDVWFETFVTVSVAGT